MVITEQIAPLIRWCIVNQWVFVGFLLIAAFLLGALDHALMIFQIRERIGFDPVASMAIGSVAGFLMSVLVTVVIVRILREK